MYASLDDKTREKHRWKTIHKVMFNICLFLLSTQVSLTSSLKELFKLTATPLSLWFGLGKDERRNSFLLSLMLSLEQELPLWEYPN